MTRQQALDDLAWLTDRLPDLWEARLWGSKPRWHEHADSATTRAEKARQARVERTWLDLNAREHMPGHSRAPLRVEILDLHAEVTTKLEAWAVILEQDPDTRTIDRVTTAAAALRDRVTYALGELEDGMTLHAVCPFCTGVTARFPGGGDRTMTVRAVPRPTRAAPDATEWLIVCEAGGCEPLQAECGTWWRGNPAWPWTDWEWLAARFVA